MEFYKLTPSSIESIVGFMNKLHSVVTLGVIVVLPNQSLRLPEMTDREEEYLKEILNNLMPKSSKYKLENCGKYFSIYLYL